VYPATIFATPEYFICLPAFDQLSSSLKIVTRIYRAKTPGTVLAFEVTRIIFAVFITP
jgi:hypothetical protein